MNVSVHLSHEQAQSLFGALVDAELPKNDERSLRSHLSECQPCQESWVRYENAVSTVRAVPRERSPMPLASVILRRERARRPSKRLHLLHAQHRVPVELILPLLIAALAVFLITLFAR